MIEITMATIGRLMKNFDIGSICRCWFELARAGVKLVVVTSHAVANLLQTFHDDALARLQSLFDRPEGTAPLSNPHRLDVDLVL